jgi:hypothetical protein
MEVYPTLCGRELLCEQVKLCGFKAHLVGGVDNGGAQHRVVRQATLPTSGRPHCLPAAGHTAYQRQATLLTSGRPHCLPAAGHTAYQRQATLLTSGRPNCLLPTE